MVTAGGQVDTVETGGLIRLLNVTHVGRLPCLAKHTDEQTLSIFICIVPALSDSVPQQPWLVLVVPLALGTLFHFSTMLLEFCFAFLIYVHSLLFLYFSLSFFVHVLTLSVCKMDNSCWHDFGILMCGGLKYALSVDHSSYYWRIEQLVLQLCVVLQVERPHLVVLWLQPWHSCGVWRPAQEWWDHWNEGTAPRRQFFVPAAQSSNPSAWLWPSAPKHKQMRIKWKLII